MNFFGDIRSLAQVFYKKLICLYYQGIGIRVIGAVTRDKVSIASSTQFFSVVH